MPRKSKEQIKKEKQYKYISEYRKNHCKQYAIKLNLINDVDIISKLESVENKTNYIRDLILKDIKNN